MVVCLFVSFLTNKSLAWTTTETMIEATSYFLIMLNCNYNAEQGEHIRMHYDVGLGSKQAS